MPQYRAFEQHLAKRGAAQAKKQVDAAHFPKVFDAGVRAG